MSNPLGRGRSRRTTYSRLDFDAANQTDRCQVVNGRTRQPVQGRPPGLHRASAGDIDHQGAERSSLDPRHQVRRLPRAGPHQRAAVTADTWPARPCTVARGTPGPTLIDPSRADRRIVQTAHELGELMDQPTKFAGATCPRLHRRTVRRQI
jgi:hypothetical protein